MGIGDWRIRSWDIGYRCVGTSRFDLSWLPRSVSFSRRDGLHSNPHPPLRGTFSRWEKGGVWPGWLASKIRPIRARPLLHSPKNIPWQVTD
ncbi:hypothetical protein C7T87_00570 [Xanthomonas hortorum pv. hederae]|nr:hypothetical protein C7T87_00570 [Xanthomonas hortorum pv. hederae]